MLSMSSVKNKSVIGEIARMIDLSSVYIKIDDFVK